MKEENMKYSYWLASMRGIKTSLKRRLVEKTGSAGALYYIEEMRLKGEFGLSEEACAAWSKHKKEWNLSQGEEELLSKGIRIIPWESPEYPERLRAHTGMPYALYLKGKLPADEQMSAAIVGARGCTPYGEKMALLYAEVLASEGVQIISGMAKGIDGAGHRGARNAGRDTYAVLGCGVDIIYPAVHRGLYRDILEHGGILSEYPPGVQPYPSHFPARNRIISALSDVILVMEARERSGSFITVDMALEQGKEVYALPGMADSLLSQGCHRLIRQGAGILLNPQELLDELGIASRNRKAPKENLPGLQEDGKEDSQSGENKIKLETPEKVVYSKIALYPKSKEEIQKETGMPASRLTAVLVSLCLKGYISEKSKDYYYIRK